MPDEVALRSQDACETFRTRRDGIPRWRGRSSPRSAVMGFESSVASASSSSPSCFAVAKLRARHGKSRPAKNGNSGIHRTEFAEQFERTRRGVSEILRSIPRRCDERSIERYMQFELLSPPGGLSASSRRVLRPTEFARGVPIGIALTAALAAMR